MYGTEFARVGGSYSTAYIGTYELLRQEGNSSVFKLRAYFYYGGGTQVNSSTSGGFYLDGTWVHSGSYSNVKPGYHLWGEKEITVNHNTDGSFPGRYVEISGQSYHIKGSAGGYLSAPKINRQATITKANDFNDEQNPYMEFTNPANFKVNLVLEFAGTSIRRDGITGSGGYTFELTDAERKLLRQKVTSNDNKLTVRYVVATLVDGVNESLWDWTNPDKTMTLINANPEFNNFEFEDINPKTRDLTTSPQNIIKGYSNVQVTIPVVDKAISKKEATMKNYRFTCGDKNQKEPDMTYSETKPVIGTIDGVPNGTFKVFATDSRNNSTPVEKLANQVIDYSPLTKISIDAYRSGGVSEEVILQLEGTINVVNFGEVTNSIKTAKVKYRVAKTDEWSTGQDIVLTVADGKFSYNGVITGDLESKGFNISNSYEVEVIVTDELSGVQFTDTFGSGIPNIAYHKNGISVMGKYDVEVGGKFQVGGKCYDHNIMTIYAKDRFDMNTKNKLNGLTSHISIGDKLIYDNSAIRIGEGITKILVSATFSYWLSSAYNQGQLVIQKNDEKYAKRWFETYDSEDPYKTDGVTISPILVDVKENDVISLWVYTGDEQSINVLADEKGTFLTVETVE